MQNNLKSFRTGAKGFPRQSSKKSVSDTDASQKKLQNTIKSFKLPLTPVEVQMAMYTTDDGIMTFKDPVIKAYMTNKQTPLAFLVKGKTSFIKNKREDTFDEFKPASKEVLDTATDEEKLEIKKLEQELESLIELESKTIKSKNSDFDNVKDNNGCTVNNSLDIEFSSKNGASISLSESELKNLNSNDNISDIEKNKN